MPTVGEDTLVGPVDAGWTVTTLKAYLDRVLDDRQRMYSQRHEHYITMIREVDRRNEARFVAMDRAVAAAFAAQEKAIGAALLAASTAVGKAEVATEARFNSVNEFRGQLGDQSRTFMPRSESEALYKQNAEKIAGLVSRMDRADARGVGAGMVVAYVFAGIGALVGVAGLLFAILR